MSDALSGDDDRDNGTLPQILRTFVPSQVPKHFKIVPLPKEISQWLIALLQKLPVKNQSRERHTLTKRGRLGDGKSTVNSLELSRTISSTIPEKRQRMKLMGVFAMALCGGQVSGPAYATLTEGTIRSTIF